MKVNILFFAGAREIVGERTLVVEVEEPSNLGHVKSELISRYPDLEPLLAKSSFSVDHEFAIMETPLRDGVEIGVIPPVSGG